MDLWCALVLYGVHEVTIRVHDPAFCGRRACGGSVSKDSWCVFSVFARMLFLVNIRRRSSSIEIPGKLLHRVVDISHTFSTIAECTSKTTLPTDLPRQVSRIH
ncbi:predicted protein [Sclerotinia sclerotiorum 1980 UF-70]|uniref:Uncharacterized protein n=1 Tax=Sclerotinia sclerotiorum (strain ATCC 18683 / 1980 / Ss-1) TaxID=665079 RepID=A7EYT7_SCLS1|nr:predicted protein [Sclerotinia sclerotiorum 1980 UF-70]EDN94629.1 predicted protein [Sclerotinia sclerotiorum 1980 UF-70]